MKLNKLFSTVHCLNLFKNFPLPITATLEIGNIVENMTS